MPFWIRGASLFSFCFNYSVHGTEWNYNCNFDQPEKCLSPPLQWFTLKSIASTVMISSADSTHMSSIFGGQNWFLNSVSLCFLYNCLSFCIKETDEQDHLSFVLPYRSHHLIKKIMNAWTSCFIFFHFFTKCGSPFLFSSFSCQLNFYFQQFNCTVITSVILFCEQLISIPLCFSQQCVTQMDHNSWSKT